MKCPTCEGNVDPTLCNVERDAQGEGLEVNFTCPGCHREHFAILVWLDFSPVAD
jgi:hypothetical protein